MQLSGQNNLVGDRTYREDELYTGYAVYNENVFYFRSIINNEWLMSVVNGNEDFENVYWGMKTIHDSKYIIQSKEARLLLLEKLNAYYQGEITIEKRSTPYVSVIKDNKELNIPVSLAHDGDFVAYAFITNQNI